MQNLAVAVANLLMARADGMVTREEWENLAKALQKETGETVEYRTRDELRLEPSDEE